MSSTRPAEPPAHLHVPPRTAPDRRNPHASIRSDRVPASAAPAYAEPPRRVGKGTSAVYRPVRVFPGSIAGRTARKRSSPWAQSENVKTVVLRGPAFIPLEMDGCREAVRMARRPQTPATVRPLPAASADGPGPDARRQASEAAEAPPPRPPEAPPQPRPDELPRTPPPEEPPAEQPSDPPPKGPPVRKPPGQPPQRTPVANGHGRPSGSGDGAHSP